MKCRHCGANVKCGICPECGWNNYYPKPVKDKGKCIRCGSDRDIEIHHKIQRVDGGPSEDYNLEPLCIPCHDYEHAKRELQKHVNKETQQNRLDVFNHRMEVLEENNTVEMILSRGTYKPYWDDKTTHYLPPKKRQKTIMNSLQSSLII